MRPAKRGDCEQMSRPCPYVSCRHHLLIDVTRKGSLISRMIGRPYVRASGKTSGSAHDKLIEGWSDDVVKSLGEMTQTCSLDVAATGPINETQIAALIGVSVGAVTDDIGRACHMARDPLLEVIHD